MCQRLRRETPPTASSTAVAAVFCTTVFGLLYDHRMAKALDLIEARRYSIAEIALRVGYASPSTFAAAFKRKYGITPKEARP